MAGAGKRNRFQLEQTRAIITKLYLKGHTMEFIVQELERETGVQISRPQVAYDIALVVQRWRKEAAGDIERAKGIELGKLNKLELEYWSPWERSCLPREITRTAKTEGEKATISASSRKEQRDGNPAFLIGVMSCIERRCRILGIDAPVKVNVEDVTREVARTMGVEEDSAVAYVEKLLRDKRYGKAG